ncbi:hypothetical protein [Microvirgula aerodenitrificans]|uniref:hypothetical protein n=1 Tax=Microvirgula aerodenitrificans TaxID=57480 RepID=UPI002F3EC31A
MPVYPIEMPEKDVDFWREKLQAYSSISSLMRDISKKYGASRNDVGVMMYSLFYNISIDEISYVWKWDMDRCGVGISDEQLDRYLSHLLNR